MARSCPSSGRSARLGALLVAFISPWVATAMAQEAATAEGRGGVVPARPEQAYRAVPPDQSPASREADPTEVFAPPGYIVELIAHKLDFPIDVAFGDDGAMYIAESGYHGFGDEPLRTPAPQIIQLRSDATKLVIFENAVPLGRVQAVDSSDGMPEGIIPPITGITWRGGRLYISHRSRISVLDLDDDDPKTRFKTIVSGLPAWGPSLGGKPTFDRDGKLVFFVPAQGNAGIVDEHWAESILVWNKLKAHDVPGEDVTLAGRNFRVPLETANSLGMTTRVPDEEVAIGEGQATSKIPYEHVHKLVAPRGNDLTGAFVPLWSKTEAGQVIKGEQVCNGAFFRCNPDGSGLERIAWGFRSCSGYRYAPDGRLVCTHDGAGPTLPRGAFFDRDSIYEVVPGEWYGWPDFLGGTPITDPRFHDRGPQGFLLTSETHSRLLKGADRPRQPLVRLPGQSGPRGFVFGRDDFGVGPETMLVAEFGTLVPAFKGRALVATAQDFEEREEIAATLPATAPPDADFNWPGFKVQAVDPRSGRVADFLRNRAPGPASAHRGRGLERPIQLEWGPDGALYVVDFGVISTQEFEGRTLLNAHVGTGTLWRVRRDHAHGGPSGQSLGSPSGQVP